MITGYLLKEGELIRLQIKDGYDGIAFVEAIEGKPFTREAARSDPEIPGEIIQTNLAWIPANQLIHVCRDGVLSPNNRRLILSVNPPVILDVQDHPEKGKEAKSNLYKQGGTIAGVDEFGNFVILFPSGGFALCPQKGVKING